MFAKHFSKLGPNLLSTKTLMLKKVFTKINQPVLPEKELKSVPKNPVRCITCGLSIEKETALEKNGKYFCPPKEIIKTDPTLT